MGLPPLLPYEGINDDNHVWDALTELLCILLILAFLL